MSPWAGTKRAPPPRWLVRACACEESLADGVRLCSTIASMIAACPHPPLF
jgi:hypothetical protein